MHDNKPIHSLGYGPIRASIWRNETAKGVFYDVTVARRYKDGEDWTSSQTFRERDLPIVAKAALDAHTWIHAQADEQALTTAFPVLVGSSRSPDDDADLAEE